MKTKDLLIYINNSQSKSLFSIDELKEKLNTKQRGLYWIWTDLSSDTLAKVIQEKDTTYTKNRHVPIGQLVTDRAGLSNICEIKNNNYKIVYNGIGGYPTIYKSSSLRQRINQELNCNNKKTGTLNFLNRKFKDDTVIKKENIKISYFNFDDENHHEILKLYTKENAVWLNQQFYNTYAKKLESLWRLEFGTPILCRQ